MAFAGIKHPQRSARSAAATSLPGAASSISARWAAATSCRKLSALPSLFLAVCANDE
jgi:hypothetical protein